VKSAAIVQGLHGLADRLLSHYDDCRKTAELLEEQNPVRFSAFAAIESPRTVLK
jgi:hypothetical protein